MYIWKFPKDFLKFCFLQRNISLFKEHSIKNHCETKHIAIKQLKSQSKQEKQAFQNIAFNNKMCLRAEHYEIPHWLYLQFSKC